MDYQFVLLNASVNVQGTTVLVFLLLFLLFCSFMLSGAEVAFFSLTYKDINLLKTKQQPSYKRIVALLEEPKILQGSLLIATVFVNIAIIILSNILISDILVFTQLLVWVGLLLKIFLITTVLILCGELMPKVMATQNNIRFAKDVGPMVEFIHYMFKRLSGWLVNYGEAIETRLSNKTNGAITNEELYHAIDVSDTGTSENEKNILKGILKFGNITVKQIMRTRMDVHGIEFDTPFDELIKQIEELHYSRLPVYKEDLDEVVGIIHTKDLLPHLNQSADFNWHTIMRQPYFVHEQKLIEDLLQDFQTKRIHFAVVVDEFGGTSGIVTLEDVLEEIIGDINDEFDDEDSNYKKIDEYNYIFEGRTMINDVCKYMELPVDTFDAVKGDSDSLAGLVLEIAGEIPHNGQVISIGDFEFTVMEIEKNRIQKIKVSIKLRLPE